MKKTHRKIISILTLLIIIFVIMYFFNIFNINYLINGISVEKLVNDNIITTTTTGKNLKLNPILKDNDISIIPNDKITKTNIIYNTKNNNQSITIDVVSNKTSQEIFDYFKNAYPSSMTAGEPDTIQTIITGSAERLIKITIEDNDNAIKYIIKLDLK